MGLGTTAALINAMTQKTEKELSSVKTAIQGKPDEKESDKTGVDFDISDPNGNVIVRFAGGGVKTKNFDSEKAAEIKNSLKTGVDFDIVSRQVGGKKSKSAFGKKESKIVGGFSVTEYSIYSGEAPVDDESEYYIDEDDFKKLFKAHKQRCEEAKNSATSKEDKPKKGLGSARTSHVDDADDDENPFDD